MKRFVLSALLPLFTAGCVAPQPRLGHESHTLSQCAIVQNGEDARVYLTAPSGEAQAVDAMTGKVAWQSRGPAHILLARGRRLLAMLPGTAKRSSCVFAVMDAGSGKILKELPWPDGGGKCMGAYSSSSLNIESFSEAGRDYLLWTHRTWPAVGGANPGLDVRPVSPDEGVSRGAIKVDLLNKSITQMDGDLPDTGLKYTHGPGSDYQIEISELEGFRIQAASEMVNQQMHLSLRRWKDSQALPELGLGDPPLNGGGLVLCPDRRHILSVFQIPGTAPILYHVSIYSTLTGEKTAEFDSSSWLAGSALIKDRLIAYFPNRIFCIEISSGRELWSLPAANMVYNGPYPP